VAQVEETVLLRYQYLNGDLQAAMPVRVVERSDSRLVAWLSPQTEIMYWALSDGRDPRSVPLDERFSHQLSTAPRRWRGNGVLRVLLRGCPYQVVHFWEDDGEFSGWSVNFETPHVVLSSRLVTRDWHLDLWITADGRHTWKDEDEAAVAVKHGHVKESELVAARCAGEAILSDQPAWLRLVGDWRGFRPRADWGALELPRLPAFTQPIP
jgi:hypothetical protein